MVQVTLQRLFNLLIQNTEAIVCYSAVGLFCDEHLQSNKSESHYVGMLIVAYLAPNLLKLLRDNILLQPRIFPKKGLNFCENLLTD